MTPFLFEENVTQFELDMGDVIGKVSTAQTETVPNEDFASAALPDLGQRTKYATTPLKTRGCYVAIGRPPPSVIYKLERDAIRGSTIDHNSPSIRLNKCSIAPTVEGARQVTPLFPGMEYGAKIRAGEPPISRLSLDSFRGKNAQQAEMSDLKADSAYLRETLNRRARSQALLRPLFDLESNKGRYAELALKSLDLFRFTSAVLDVIITKMGGLQRGAACLRVNLLFRYRENHGVDFAADMAKMAAGRILKLNNGGPL
jgi:hypothetical protein